MDASPARRLLAAVSCLGLLAQTTGAADLSPVPSMLRLPPPTALLQPPPPRPVAAAPPAVVAQPPANLIRIPDTPPVADRMLVKKEKGFVGAVSRAIDEPDIRALLRRLRPRASGPRPLFADRLEQPWVEGSGVRLRVVYLKPVGVTWGDASGFHGQVLPGPILDLRARVPEAYRRSFPLYFAGDSVDYEVELENVGPLPLSGLALRARQERFNPAGAAGEPLGRVDLQDLPALPWGGRAVVRGSFRLSAGGRARLNFEQTHLSVVLAGPRAERVLLDAPQAGIADPPGER